MKLTFLGAAGEVTGSSALVETDRCRFLVDCGMFQGSGPERQPAALRNAAAMQRDLGPLDFVLLTHAHLDHCGLTPRFGTRGPAPQLWCTRPTQDLLAPMLRDSAHIQSFAATRGAGRRRGRDTPVAPLYDHEAVDRLLTRVSGVPVDARFEPHPSVSAVFRHAGHIVGAAFVELTLQDAGTTRRVVFSGDLGEASPLMVRDRAPLSGADLVVLESTYGDRDHRSLAATEDELVQVLDEVLHARHGNLIVPAFALGRTQEFVLLLYRLALAGRIRVPLVFVDSPLARAASEVTFRHLEALDDEAHRFLADQQARRLPFTLRYTESVDDSMFLNSLKSGALIVAASGMCDAGRIRHHLRHNLGRRECGVLFTGYQARGTLGRRLVDGAREVPLFGERVPVRASIHTLGGLSAHAGQSSLLQWLRGAAGQPQQLYLVHGEPAPLTALAARIEAELGWRATIAAPLTPYRLA